MTYGRIDRLWIIDGQTIESRFVRHSTVCGSMSVELWVKKENVVGLVPEPDLKVRDDPEYLLQDFSRGLPCAYT